MGDRITYRGRVVEANPKNRPDTGMWSHDRVVEHHTGPEVIVEEFSTPGESATREEAVEQNLVLGRQYLDRKLA